MTSCSKPRGFILVESTQIRWFSRWSGWVGWSSRAVAQQRPWVSKLGLKGLSDYHSNETAVEADCGGPVGQINGLLSWHVYSKKESWKTALNLTEKGQNAVRKMKSTTGKKRTELLTLTLGEMHYGRNKGDDNDDGWEPVEPITSPCDSSSAKKSV
jgi:hypothetical protein